MSAAVEPLAAFLAVEDADPVWVIDQLLATGANAVLVAPYKAGKSTMRDNLVRALADGTPFLGAFETRQRRVAVIDAELDARTMRRWLRDHGIQSIGNVGVTLLRGRVSTFDLLDDDVRSEWATALHGYDVLILDCLRPVLDALGLSEDKDAGRFLVALDALSRAAGVQETIVVHHAGHSSGRARGDSRILDWPDAIWTITRSSETGPRSFSALGRDVDVPRGGLQFDAEHRRLTYAQTAVGHADSAAVAASDRLVERLEAMTVPPTTANEAVSVLGGRRSDALAAFRAFRARRDASGSGNRSEPPRNQEPVHVAEVVPGSAPLKGREPVPPLSHPARTGARS